MKKILLILLLTILSCESPKDTKTQSLNKDNPYHKEINSLVKETEKLEDQLSRNIIMRNATSRQVNSFTEIIFEIKKLLLLLDARPKNNTALIRLFEMKNEISAMPIQSRDIEFIEQYLKDLDQIMIRLMQYQKRVIADLNWEVWSENFDNGLGKFTTFSSSDNWIVGNRNRQGYISVRSRNAKAWLITPLLNLNNLTNPAFRLNHLVNIKKNENSAIDSQLINESAIKVYASTNYEFGDPELAQWEEISIKDVPLITDFNAHKSEKISLSKYTNEVISLAFVLDLKRDIGGHGLLWQINEVSLFGASDNSQNTERPLIIERKDPTQYAYQYDFTNGIGNFQQVVEGENPAEFEEITRNEETYLQINGFKNKSNGVNLLVGEPIELKDLNYSIRLKQAINFYNQAAIDKGYIKILIGENQDDINAIEWKELKFQNTPPGNAWTPITSEWLKLNYQNQTIRLAFRYESGNGLSEYPNWSLYFIDIKEEVE